MPLITVPSRSYATISWKLIRPAQVNVSTWTGARQVLPSGRGWWEATVVLPPLVGEAAVAPWRSFIAQAADPSAYFDLHVDELDQFPTSLSTLVDGASQTGYSLQIDGLAVSTAYALNGKFMSITMPSTVGGNQMVQLVADSTSSSGGSAITVFVPALRASPADNAAVALTDPVCRMYMVDYSAIGLEPGRVANISFTCREAY